MDKIVLILGAGAHQPFGFPLGYELVDNVAESLEEWASGAPEDEHRTAFLAARRDLLDSGVASIDQFLTDRGDDYNGIIRPLLALSLLKEENNYQSGVVTDWLKYALSLFLDGQRKSLSTRVAIVTFNYDRTLEYLLARALAGRWKLDLDEAYASVEKFGIYHVYGTLGSLSPYSEKHLAYGAKDEFMEAADRIRIIGEQHATITNELHAVIADASYVFMLGCGFNTQNMSILSLGDLPPRRRRIVATTCGLSKAERERLARNYRYLTLCEYAWNCDDFVRHDEDFQSLW